MKAEAFLRHFGSKNHGTLVRMHHGVYDVPSEISNVLESIQREPFGAGMYLGEEREDFRPSPGVLHLIKDTKNQVLLNKEATWLLTCGRDIFLTNIIGPCPEGLVLVKNEAGDPLGIGEKHGNILRNVMDLGSFLRREKTDK